MTQIQADGLPKFWSSDRRFFYRRLVELLGGAPARQALSAGIARKCPICGSLHPGIWYLVPVLRDFCSQECREESQVRAHRWWEGL